MRPGVLVAIIVGGVLLAVDALTVVLAVAFIDEGAARKDMVPAPAMSFMVSQARATVSVEAGRTSS